MAKAANAASKSRLSEVDPVSWTPEDLCRRSPPMPSKGRKRAPYPPEFRRQMVDLVRAGRTPKELEREFEPTAQTIRNWVAQADRDEGRRADGLTSAERQELQRLRRENRQLKVERDTGCRVAGSHRCDPCGCARDVWCPPHSRRACSRGHPPGPQARGAAHARSGPSWRQPAQVRNYDGARRRTAGSRPY